MILLLRPARAQHRNAPDTLLVYVTVTSGTSAIAGGFATVDNVTRDGSTIDMSAVD